MGFWSNFFGHIFKENTVVTDGQEKAELDRERAEQDGKVRLEIMEGLLNPSNSGQVGGGGGSAHRPSTEKEPPEIAP
jgi:hypothetical protein